MGTWEALATAHDHGPCSSAGLSPFFSGFYYLFDDLIISPSFHPTSVAAAVLWTTTWPFFFNLFILYCSFPDGRGGKESACNAGDSGLIPSSGRSPGEGNGCPLQYSWLENSMDRGARQATVHGVSKIGPDWAIHTHTHTHTHTHRLKVSGTLDIFSMFSNFVLPIFDYLQEISEASFSLISTRLYFLLSNISICLFASLSAKPEPKTRVYCVFLLASPL